MSGMMKKCCNCRADLPATNGSGGAAVQCEKCQKNELKYGKPTTCKYCQLPAAFLDQKCVHCCYSERKFGTPVSCAKCKLKAAFCKEPAAKHTKAILCRMCLLQTKTTKAPSSAKKPSASAHNSSRSSAPGSAQKRKHKDDAREESSVLKVRKDGGGDVENVLRVQELKDKIDELQRTIGNRDHALLEKDKKIASLRADIASAERRYREKFEQMLKEKEDAIHAVHEKYKQQKKEARAEKAK